MERRDLGGYLLCFVIFCEKGFVRFASFGGKSICVHRCPSVAKFQEMEPTHVGCYGQIDGRR